MKACPVCERKLGVGFNLKADHLILKAARLL
jgi:hypothetical protein